MALPRRVEVRHRNSTKFRRAREQMFMMYGTVCHICGHDGAGEADHVVPISLDPDQPVDPHALRPAHGSSSPCPVCVGSNGRPRACNQERGKKTTMLAPLRTSREW